MIILTIAEIMDLAEFAGFTVVKDIDTRDLDMEVCIIDASPGGIEDESGEVKYYDHIAYFLDCPREGSIPLGSGTKPKWGW